jgi:archaetidylinositol phosphate synthase
MNITAFRPRFIRYLEPVADVFIGLGITPNQISMLALIAGIASAFLFFQQRFLLESVLFLSAV